MNKVSICVPTYNNVSEVKRLIESIKKQTYLSYEVIITDDSKNSEIEEYINSDTDINEKIRYYHNETTLGHIINWNYAISLAKGKFVKIMFSDDWFAKEDSLEKMVKALEHCKEAELVFSRNYQVLNGKKPRERFIEEYYIKELQEDYRYLFISNQIGAPSNVMFRNNIESRFDEKSNWASDVFLYFEILKQKKKFAFIDEPLICIGEHENQYTYTFEKNDERIYNDYKYLYQKYGLEKEKKYRNYFLERYILMYNKKFTDVKELGYKRVEYYKHKYLYMIKNRNLYYNALKNKMKRR